MFKHQLATEKGRQIKRAFYDSLIANGCNPAHALIAAEAMALETENSNYHRTDYDKRAISNCWHTITNSNE